MEIEFSEEDSDLVSLYRWHISNVKDKKYVRTTIYHPKKEVLYLHHLIIGKPQRGFSILFVDGNTLNCKRDNLIHIKSHTKSHIIPSKSFKYRGIYIRNGFYHARISYDGKTHYLGKFKSEEEAIITYDLMAIEFFEIYAQTSMINAPTI